MEIRNYQLKDLNAVKQIFIESQNFHAKSRPDVFKTVTTITDKDFQVFLSDINIVATIDQKVVGFAIATLKNVEENILIKSKQIFKIEFLGITENWKNHKIGTELMKVLEQIAKSKKTEMIQFDYWTFNVNARKLYDKLGYTSRYETLEKKVGD